LAALRGSGDVVIRTITFLLSASLSWAGPLDEGRKALQNKDLPAALQAYKAIGPTNTLWSDKLEDLTRYLLMQNEALEAWRVLQIAHRTKAFRPSMQDLEQLAVYRNQACPLALPIHDEVQTHLLTAATYRFNATMFDANSRGTPDASSETHLVVGATPYLQDIPEMEIIHDRGCRIAKWQVRRTDQVERAEYSELIQYLAVHREMSKDRLLIFMRALELASAASTVKVKTKFEKGLPEPEVVPWMELPDPERQWLFSKVFHATKLAQISPGLQPKAQVIALQAALESGASPYWLAMIDSNSLSSAERVRLLAEVEKRGNFEGRAWVLYELAVAHSEMQNPREALTVLRRLLLEGEENLDPALEQACIGLASQMFVVFRNDSGLMGALQAAIPARLWNGLLEQAMARSALAGQYVEFARLKKMREGRMHYSGVNSLDTRLNEALARRNLARFTQDLGHGRRGADFRILDYAKKFVAYGFEQQTLPALKPFRVALVNRLHEMAVPGTQQADETNDLAVLLDEDSNSAATRNGRSVRKGVERVGVVQWINPDLKPATFALRPPGRLPRRELFFVPDSAAGRGWALSTAVR
jgi:hypothetical protein